MKELKSYYDYYNEQLSNLNNSETIIHGAESWYYRAFETKRPEVLYFRDFMYAVTKFSGLEVASNLTKLFGERDEYTHDLMVHHHKAILLNTPLAGCVNVQAAYHDLVCLFNNIKQNQTEAQKIVELTLELYKTMWTSEVMGQKVYDGVKSTLQHLLFSTCEVHEFYQIHMAEHATPENWFRLIEMITTESNMTMMPTSLDFQRSLFSVDWSKVETIMNDVMRIKFVLDFHKEHFEPHFNYILGIEGQAALYPEDEAHGSLLHPTHKSEWMSYEQYSKQGLSFDKHILFGIKNDVIQQCILRHYNVQHPNTLKINEYMKRFSDIETNKTSYALLTEMLDDCGIRITDFITMLHTYCGVDIQNVMNLWYYILNEDFKPDVNRYLSYTEELGDYIVELSNVLCQIDEIFHKDFSTEKAKELGDAMNHWIHHHINVQSMSTRTNQKIINYLIGGAKPVNNLEEFYQFFYDEDKSPLMWKAYTSLSGLEYFHRFIQIPLEEDGIKLEMLENLKCLRDTILSRIKVANKLISYFNSDHKETW